MMTDKAVRTNRKKSNDGVTLIELLVVISIIGILTVALGFSYEGWMGNYRMESQTKTLYSDLMDARTRAMTTCRAYFVELKADQYQIYRDENNNLQYDAGIDSAVFPSSKRIEYNYKMAFMGASTLPAIMSIDTRGFIDPQRNLRIYRPVKPLDPDYNCITLRQARIRMGKTSTDGTSCEEK